LSDNTDKMRGQIPEGEDIAHFSGGALPRLDE